MMKGEIFLAKTIFPGLEDFFYKFSDQFQLSEFTRSRVLGDELHVFGRLNLNLSEGWKREFHEYPPNSLIFREVAFL